MSEQVDRRKPLAIGAGTVLALAFAMGAWALALTSSSGSGRPSISNGDLPVDIVFETPTVGSNSSDLSSGTLPASEYREKLGDGIVGQVIDVVEAGNYPELAELLSWSERECLVEGSERQLSCEELGLPVGVTTYRAFTLQEYVALPQPEPRLQETLERYLAAEPNLIAAAESTDDQGLVFVEFALDAPATTTLDHTDPTYSFTLAIRPGAEPPVQFFQTIELIYFVREQAKLGVFPTEMVYIGPDAKWRDDTMHAADERCRTVDSGCEATIEWPNGTWPSRQ